MTGAGPDPALAWDSFIAETQFATELVAGGFRYLCQVPLPSDMLFAGSEDDAKYPLHLALHSLTSGVERLAKLTLLLVSAIESGEFVPVRRFSHGLVDLYAAVAEASARCAAGVEIDVQFPELGSESFCGRVLSFLNSFAEGAGRYSYLDTLGNGERRTDPYLEWVRLCGETPDASPRIARLLWIYDEMVKVVYDCDDADVEALLQPLLDARPTFLSVSTVTALRVYEIVEPLARLYSKLSYHAFYVAAIRGIPLLAEITERVFAKDPEDFLAWSIMQLGDDDVLFEVLSERSDRAARDDDSD